VGRAAKLAYQRQSADMTATEALLRFPSRKTGARSPGNAVAGLEVRAPEVVGNLYSRQAEAHGGVVLRTASGMVGETERALFDGNAMKAVGPSPVSIRGPGYTLDAQGFNFVFDDETFTFEGETHTVLGDAAAEKLKRPAAKTGAKK
jgi:lipopolysaccharide export system protein LptC